MEAPAVRPEAKRLHKPVVLIVDDENGIRDFLRSAFEAEGYTVLAAADGEAALALCERYRPDVILLDVMMPRLDGFGFLAGFRCAYGDSTPVYMMSAAWTAIDRAHSAGVAGTFVKPFDLDEVLTTVAAAAAAPRDRLPPVLGHRQATGHTEA